MYVYFQIRFDKKLLRKLAVARQRVEIWITISSRTIHRKRKKKCNRAIWWWKLHWKKKIAKMLIVKFHLIITYWIGFNFIVIVWNQLNWLQLYWAEMNKNMNETEVIWIGGVEWECIELNWIELHMIKCFDLNWIRLNYIWMNNIELI